MTDTTYANPEAPAAEGYLHLAMAPDGTLIGRQMETEAQDAEGNPAEVSAEKLLEAIRGLEERMSRRIDGLASNPLPARPAPESGQPAEHEPLAAAEPQGEPAPPFEEGRTGSDAPAQPSPEADAQPEGEQALPQPDQGAGQAEPRRSALPYVIVSALLIVAGLGAIACAGLYLSGVI